MKKKREYITITTETNIYIDDYLDDFMTVASDEDLIEEIEKRGMWYIKKESLLLLLESNLLNLTIQPI